MWSTVSTNSRRDGVVCIIPGDHTFNNSGSDLSRLAVEKASRTQGLDRSAVEMALLAAIHQ